MNDIFEIKNGILIHWEGNKITKIPEEVREIKKDTIEYPFLSEELYLPDSLEHVEVEALSSLHSLRKLKIPARFFSSWDSNNSYRLHTKYGGRVNTSAILFSFFGLSIPSKLQEIVIFGEEKELDWSYFDWEWLLRNNRKIVIRIENEVTSIRLGDKVIEDSYGSPKIYINNYIEKVSIDYPPVKWDQKNILFRAPKANQTVLQDNAVELTLAPRDTFYDENRWDCPIKINISAITYLYPVELSCYESEKLQGCKLLLLGNRIEDIPLEQLTREIYPFVIVWENYDTVYNKLKAKGWTR